MDATCEVAIVGGGPAGSAAAIVLARAGLDVTLIDAGARRAFKLGEGLTPATWPLLRTLDVIERVRAQGHRESHGTWSAWASPEPRADDHLRGVQGSGLQLDRVRFDAVLRDAARDAGARVIERATARLMSAGDGHQPHRLHWRDRDGATQALTARWLIDATGRSSSLARALGARRVVHDELLAFALRFRGGHDDDRDGRTWIEAVPEGWWYAVLLPTRDCLIVFLGDGDLIERAAWSTASGFRQHLARTTLLRARVEAHGWLPRDEPVGADAASACLDRFAGPRWFAVGDAAQSFDPLSSKGIANALHTGIAAARALIADEGGDARAIARHDEHLRAIFDVYRVQACAVYGMNARWPEAPFWRRRRAPMATLGASAVI